MRGTVKINEKNASRVRKTVKRDLHADVLIMYETELEKHLDYWERAYIVAWKSKKECGTHRVCINGYGHEMCVWGHYGLTEEEARDDAMERVK